jgi:4-amino-4-deoxy-L-arabinose transferase-like glycosyltransferase
MFKRYLTTKNITILMIVATILFALSRLVFLDADPTLFKRTNDIGDEGYWVHEARSAVLFGKWIMDEHVMSIASAPLSALISYLSFSAFGVSVITTRLTMAVSGVLSILIIFLIGNRYERRLGLISAFILSIVEIFFMYNRIGHMESLVILSLLLMFYFISNKRSDKRSLFYLLGGVALGLAFLAKITTIYYVLIVGIYLLVSLYRSDIKIKDIIFFGIGGALISLPWIAFSFIPNRDSYLHVLNALSEANYQGKLIIFSHPFLLFTGIYFSYISVFFMGILSLYYMKKRDIFSLFNNFKDNIAKLNEIELIALSWLFGGFLGVLLTDMVSRRYTLMVIPFVLLSSLFIFDDVKMKKFKISKKLSFFSLLLISLCIMNMLYYPIVAISGISFIQRIIDSVLGGNSNYNAVITTSHTIFILILLGSIIASAIYAYYNNLKDNSFTKFINKLLPVIGGLSIFITLSVTLLYSNFIYLRRILPSHIANTILLVIVGLIVIAGIGFLIKRVSYIFFGLFVAFCIGNIIFNIVFPQFTIRNGSRELSKLTESDEWIIGPLGHQLALENGLKPLYFVPNEVGLDKINTNAVENYNPRYFIEEVDGETDDPTDLGWPKLEDLEYKSKYLGSIEIFDYGFGSQYTFKVYEIDYSEPI